jgi:hypothetical protein
MFILTSSIYLRCVARRETKTFWKTLRKNILKQSQTIEMSKYLHLDKSFGHLKKVLLMYMRGNVKHFCRRNARRNMCILTVLTYSQNVL